MINRKYVSIKIDESTLAQRNKELGVLLDMSTSLSANLSTQEILQLALNKVLDHFDYDAGRIYLKGDNPQVLTLAACRGLSCEKYRTVSVKNSFTGKAFRTSSFIAQRVSELEDQKRAAFLEKQGLKIIICIPLISMDTVIGVMNLATGTIIRLRETDIDLLIVTGNLIAAAVNNAQVYGELQQKVNEIKEKKDLIEFFAYASYHDLKNPLIGVHGLSKLLCKQYSDVLDGKGQDYCKKILTATEHIREIVESINDYVKAKEAALNLEMVSMKEVTESIFDQFAHALKQRHISWQEPHQAPTILLDKVSITRVLVNLVDNALKYGGLGLNEFRIEYNQTASHYVISLSNNGAEIPEDEREKLFTVFQRGTTSSGTEGTGMGLAIVKAIAERHGGTVWLNSGADKKVTFCVSIAKHLDHRKTTFADQKSQVGASFQHGRLETHKVLSSGQRAACCKAVRATF